MEYYVNDSATVDTLLKKLQKYVEICTVCRNNEHIIQRREQRKKLNTLPLIRTYVCTIFSSKICRDYGTSTGTVRYGNSQSLFIEEKGPHFFF